MKKLIKSKSFKECRARSKEKRNESVTQSQHLAILPNKFDFKLEEVNKQVDG